MFFFLGELFSVCKCVHVLCVCVWREGMSVCMGLYLCVLVFVRVSVGV